jgi:hypothetical protein
MVHGQSRWEEGVMNNPKSAKWILSVFILLMWCNGIADEKTAGTVRNGVYTSPDKSFQFDIPKLIDPGAFVLDVREHETSFKVAMGDDFCRRIFVLQHARDGFTDFEGFTHQRKSMMQMVSMESRELSIPAGRAVLITGGMPHAPVCAVMTFGEGGQLVPGEAPGSDAGIVFLETDDAFYELGYMLDEERTFAGFYGVADIEEVVEKLATSFKVIGPRTSAQLPAADPLIRFVDIEDLSHCEIVGPIKGKSTSFAASIDKHMSRAQSKLRQEAGKLGANAIVIRNSQVKTSRLTGYPYMQLVADAFVCESVPAYKAWEIRAAN